MLFRSGVPVDMAPDWNAVVPRVDMLAALDGGGGSCGNGILDPGEGCDDGVDNGTGCCTAECQAVADGISCDDGSNCTEGSSCLSASCQGGTPIDCSGFSTQCATGACDPVTGCVAQSVQNGTTCDDGAFCTVNDTCVDGECTADRKSTRLNSSHSQQSRMPSSA